MGVRDSNRLNASHSLYGCYHFVVEQADAVPEYIALGAANQQCPLPDSECRSSADANQVWLMLSDLVAQSVLLHCRECCPFLSRRSNVLALVEANRAFARWLLAFCKLRSTGYAYPVF